MAGARYAMETYDGVVEGRGGEKQEAITNTITILQVVCLPAAYFNVQLFPTPDLVHTSLATKRVASQRLHMVR